MSAPPPVAKDVSHATAQFGLNAIFGMIFALALYFAYLRHINATAVIYGCVAIGIGVAIGAATGVFTGHFADTVYWAALCAALGYLATADEPRGEIAFRLAWATVGALAAAGTHCAPRNRPLRRIAVATIGAALAMGVYLQTAGDGWQTSQFDAICAPLVGFLISVLIQVLQYLEADRRLPRYTIATWLLCAVLAGNLAVAYFVWQ